MNGIKEKIEKLLRLSMSDNLHEAQLAATRAIELMQKYSLEREDITGEKLASRTFEIDYARIPVWIRELYCGLAYINGCYMVWIDGRRDFLGESLEVKAKIVLTGREADVLNAEYLLQVFIREIETRAYFYSQNLGRCRNKRVRLKAYRLGLGRGLVDRMTESMECYESRETYVGLKNAPIPMDDRYQLAKEFYLKDKRVRSIETKIDVRPEYYLGLREAEKVDIHRPLYSQDKVWLLSLNQHA